VCGSPLFLAYPHNVTSPHPHSRGIDWFLDPREHSPSDRPSRIGPVKTPFYDAEAVSRAVRVVWIQGLKGLAIRLRLC